jgi:predicted nucleotide-binding protein
MPQAAGPVFVVQVEAFPKVPCPCGIVDELVAANPASRGGDVARPIMEDSKMVNSRYERASYTYEVVDIDPQILLKLSTKLNEGENLIKTANENEITPYHLAWIKSFEPFIEQIDPNGELDTWSGNHSESLIKRWNHAQYGGNYSIAEKESLTPKYVDAQIFSAYLTVLLSLQNGKAKIVKTKNIIPIRQSDDDGDSSSKPIEGITTKSKVFIVHGHDGEAKSEVARFIEKLGPQAIILHELPNKGRTIISKFREEAADVGFAIILMTPDDHGGIAAQNTRPRARQNVIFELGFFIGALRPDKVAALVKGDIERPSDFDGVVYTELDERGAWRWELGKELQAAGFQIDWNKAMA